MPYPARGGEVREPLSPLLPSLFPRPARCRSPYKRYGSLQYAGVGKAVQLEGQVFQTTSWTATHSASPQLELNCDDPCEMWSQAREHKSTVPRTARDGLTLHKKATVSATKN
ncbi:uncharacterized protein PGTG_18557 [Puccinia graminis f. sp. tritici CRL 75-36-700-3]|uniref:Uncharacterized protein n=1 Tax=Puccinia graminis f. sp. tritici (strain CRL 75-36-700-3 / race SCCL) TaxID=418459 RepID=E3L5D2_PUCGT|nr:uncharacterized protein PGTG_18557 [Puccinia graminis f. sp. tritici CRL 75-36-700-3]EFP92559.1 hypothetical protein PGTG_18557 [Puccinia graminis f. sp. tritici CRL 75-36-700-3]